MGALTLRMLARIAFDEVGADPSSSLEMREQVNQAGEHLVAMYPWRWLEGRQLRLRPRAQIDISGATWTEATLTLTKVGAFADYELLAGDTFDLTSGTGATTGTYEVATNPTDDTITLTTSIGAAANGQTDIAGAMRNDRILITGGSDIQAITGYSMTNGLIGRLRFTTPQTMLDLRSWPNVGSTVGFWALLNYVRSTAGGQPVLGMDLWPATESNDEELVIFYRGGWIEPADDDDAITIPGWMNGLFIEVVKAVVMGIEEPESGTVDQRLGALRGGVMFKDAYTRDAMLMPDLGPLEHGWLTSAGEGLTRFDIPPPLISTP